MLEHFLEVFDVEVAASPVLRDRVAQLRHIVYCEELRYEPASVTRRERDTFDGHALFLLLTHRASEKPAGCVRLILASANHSLALEEHCTDSLHIAALMELSRDRGEICEFSRLAVDPSFRKRRGECQANGGDYASHGRSQDERRIFSSIGIATLLSAFAAAELLDRQRVFGMMEPTLPRLLHRAGIPVRPAGDPMDYHGRRAAYFITTGEAVAGMRSDVATLYREIRSRLGSSLHTRDACGAVA
ncbi:MAG: PEP-CTERM/exosortase system-associated acyltransferase [Halieaceae bacterium]|nr:PEP-CTERM/exosortase system-associated acyltransferase [Halieaceae bacterium]